MSESPAIGQDLSPDEPIEKTIIRSMAEGVITVECNGDIHTANPAALRILNLDETELIGRRFEDVFSGPEHHPLTNIFARVQTSEGTFQEEISFKRNDGQVVDISVTASFLNVDDCQPGKQSVAIVFRDITSFKSLERVKRRAANHLSHEMKTPLAIIKASVKNLSPLDETKFTKSLGRISRNLQRLSDIQAVVEDILTPPKYNVQEVSVLPYMDKILNELKERASHRSVALVSHFGNLQTAKLDPDILGVVLTTLIKNAIENTPDGGEVSIFMEDKSDAILLQVIDGGVGIPLIDQEFIFEGFHHTQNTDAYSTKKPFDFNAGGKGLELLRLRTLADEGYFDIAFESSQCKYISNRQPCPGIAESCPHVQDLAGCRDTGGSIFSVVFKKIK